MKNIKRFYCKAEWCSMPWFLICCESYKKLDIGWFTVTDYIIGTPMAENPIYKQFIAEMGEFMVEEFPRKNRCESQANEENSMIYVFLYSGRAVKVLKKYTVSLFMNDCLFAGASMIPQDFNLFRKDGTVILSTVSSEGVANVYLSDVEIASLSLPPDGPSIIDNQFVEK